jgi:hypothetical protein
MGILRSSTRMIPRTRADAQRSGVDQVGRAETMGVTKPPARGGNGLMHISPISMGKGGPPRADPDPLTRGKILSQPRLPTWLQTLEKVHGTLEAIS